MRKEINIQRALALGIILFSSAACRFDKPTQAGDVSVGAEGNAVWAQLNDFNRGNNTMYQIAAGTEDNGIFSVRIYLQPTPGGGMFTTGTEIEGLYRRYFWFQMEDGNMDGWSFEFDRLGKCLQLGVIPIERGAANYNTAAFTPEVCVP